MVPSNISHSVPQQPESLQPEPLQPESLQQEKKTKRKAKEHSQITLWGVAAIFFVLGSAATTLTIWQLHKLYRATVAPVITVEGTLRAKYDYQDGDELRPDPSGYFVESVGVGRVYLTGKPLEGYVGQPVTAEGSVAGICGPKSIPCFPLIEVREVERLKDTQ